MKKTWAYQGQRLKCLKEERGMQTQSIHCLPSFKLLLKPRLMNAHIKILLWVSSRDRYTQQSRQMWHSHSQFSSTSLQATNGGISVFRQ